MWDLCPRAALRAEENRPLFGNPIRLLPSAAADPQRPAAPASGLLQFRVGVVGREAGVPPSLGLIHPSFLLLAVSH